MKKIETFSKLATGMAVVMIILCLVTKQWYAVPAWVLVAAYQITIKSANDAIKSGDRLITVLEERIHLLEGVRPRKYNIEDISPIDN